MLERGAVGTICLEGEPSFVVLTALLRNCFNSDKVAEVSYASKYSSNTIDVLFF